MSITLLDQVAPLYPLIHFSWFLWPTTSHDVLIDFAPPQAFPLLPYVFDSDLLYFVVPFSRLYAIQFKN